VNALEQALIRSRNLVRDAFEPTRAQDTGSARLPQASGIELPYYPGGGPGVSSFTSAFGLINQAAEQYRNNVAWFYAGGSAICKRIAGQPLHVAEKEHAARVPKQKRVRNKRLLPGAQKDLASSVNILEEHELLTLLNNPNPMMVRWSFIYVTVASLLITGKSFWWILQDEEGKWTIWPVPTHWIQPDMDEKTGRFFGRWKLQPFNSAQTTYIPGDQIVYFHFPDPGNPLSAISPMQAAAKSVIVDGLLSEAQKRTFLNGAMPELALVVGRLPDDGGIPGTGPGSRTVLTDRQRNDLLAAFKARYRGVLRAGEPIILDGLIEDIKKLSNSPREMDFQKSKLMTKNEILQSLGVNPAVMGQLEGANRASAAIADENFAKCTVNPIIELLSEFMTVFVAPRFSRTTQLVVFIEEASGSDPALVLQQYGLGFKQGAVSVNEYRTNILSLPPIAGGDCCYLPVNLQKVPIVPEAETRGEQVAGQADEGEMDVSADEQNSRGLGRGAYHCLARHLSRPALLRAWDKRLRAAETRLRIAAADGLRLLGAGIVERLRKAIADQGLAGAPALVDAAVPPNSEVADQLREALREAVRGAFASGASHEWELYRPRSRREILGILVRARGPAGASIPPTETEADRHVEDALAQPWLQGLAQDVREQVVRDVQKGIEEGLTGPEIAKRIRDRLDADAETRAEQIARAEATGALNAGIEGVRRALAAEGLVAQKEWCAIGEDAREPNVGADGQRVQPDQDFLVGAEQAAYPGDLRLSVQSRGKHRGVCLSVLSDEESLGERAVAFIGKYVMGDRNEQ
jgi:HK97 family phage portal protein